MLGLAPGARFEHYLEGDCFDEKISMQCTIYLTLKIDSGAQLKQYLAYIVRTDVRSNFIRDCKSLFVHLE